MPLVIPPVGGSLFPSQAVPDITDLQALTLALASTGVVSGCAVTAQTTPNMTVAVASGTVKIGGTNYVVSAVSSLPIANANTTDRKDIVVVSVVSNAAVVSVIRGTQSDYVIGGIPRGMASPTTPWNNPVKPNLPTGYVLLASIYLAGTDFTTPTTSISAGNITDKRCPVISLVTT